VGVNPLQADVVITGGGPVGLWTAIQTKLRTGKNVVVLEKYMQYQRSNIYLNVDPSSLTGIPEDIELKEITEGWSKKRVAISKMEDALAKKATKLGIKILRGFNANPKELPTIFPHAHVFIGADGARSVTRKELFNDEMQFRTPHQYIAQIKYTVQDSPDEAAGSSYQKLDSFISNWKVTTILNRFVNPTIKRKPDGSVEVTLQIFIGKNTYDRIKGHTFKAPADVLTQFDSFPGTLQRVLRDWYGAHKELNISPLQEGSRPKLVSFALNSYAAKYMHTTDEKGRHWALVGDAAAGFPFFRSLNNGLLLGTNLSQSIEKSIKARESGLDHTAPLKGYETYAQYRVSLEYFTACIKNFFIRIYQSWIDLNSTTCLKSLYVKPHELRDIENRGNQLLQIHQ